MTFEIPEPGTIVLLAVRAYRLAVLRMEEAEVTSSVGWGDG